MCWNKILNNKDPHEERTALHGGKSEIESAEWFTASYYISVDLNNESVLQNSLFYY